MNSHRLAPRAFVRADVSDAEAALNLVEQVVATFGRVDCVANVAATTSREVLVDTTLSCSTRTST